MYDWGEQYPYQPKKRPRVNSKDSQINVKRHLKKEDHPNENNETHGYSEALAKKKGILTHLFNTNFGNQTPAQFSPSNL